jgi:uncharacterized membrane protein
MYKNGIQPESGRYLYGNIMSEPIIRARNFVARSYTKPMKVILAALTCVYVLSTLYSPPITYKRL